MSTIRMLPLLCSLLAGAFTLTTIPPESLARKRRKKRKKRSKRSRERAEKRKRLRKAKRLYRRAQQLYRLGRFVRARKLYEKAYEITSLAGFLYNIAQCHRFEKNYERAIYFYKSYLGARPHARNAPLVATLIKKTEQLLRRQRRLRQDAAARRRADQVAAQKRADRLARLKAQLEAAKNKPKVVVMTPPPPKKKPLVKKWWFWTSIAGGVAAIVVTSVLLGLNASGPGSWPSTSVGLLDRRLP